MISENLSSRSEAENKNGKLISIEDLVARAKRFGVDFGNGDPKNRLRYYVKMGLLPHAQRKSFNGLPPNGAYTEKDLEILIEIDKELKLGKSIQEIKRGREEKVFEKKSPEISSPGEYAYRSGFGSFQLKNEFSQLEKEWEESEDREVSENFAGKILTRIPAVFKTVFLFLICISVFFFANSKIHFIDSISYFLANISEFRELAQLPVSSLEGETFIFPGVDPYLTINAETAINAPLSVREKITAPTFVLLEDEFEGRISTAGLTADREYNFPDLSGTICLATGNCVGLAGEVISSGGTVNRLSKFISARELADSSIIDSYLGGVAIAIDSAGNVGIGIENPIYDLHVAGTIQATGDICTDLAGGRCLSTLVLGGGRTSAGVRGSGAASYLPIWTGAATLGNSILYQTGGNIGIGTIAPTQKLDVAGIIKMTGFQLPTGAALGYVLTADEFGFGTWQVATGSVPMGTVAGQTLRYSGTNWLADSFLYNTGSAIGIGTTSTTAALTVAGSGLFQGNLTIENGQLALLRNGLNSLIFTLADDYAEISASSTLIINSLSGEIWLAGGVNLFDASGAEIRGKTFISTTTDSTVRKSGEKVFRSAIPIFRFPVPAQTTSTDFVVVSREISPSMLNATLPDALPGATRQFAFLINFADSVPGSASSTWLVDLIAGSDIEFYFTGQGLSAFDEGVPHLSDFILPPESSWQLKVKVPSASTIRIFNILLLVYDEIN